MANNPSADEVSMQRQLRAWTQRGGPRPGNRMRYAGADEQYIMFGDISDPIRGGIDPIRNWDPYTRDRFRQIGISMKPPNLSSGKISFKRRHGGISWLAGDLTCPNNYYELAGQCEKPDDFGLGWSDFLTVYSYAFSDNRTYTKRTSDTADDPLMDEIDCIFSSVYDLGGLSFGENAAPQVEREVVQAIYGGSPACGTCGVQDDGSQRIYAVTKSSGAASPGIPSEVVWSVNGGLTYNNQNITGLGGTVDPTGIAQVGNFLVVLDTAGTGYWYAELDPLTGTPANWTNVTLGFTAGSPPTDIYVLTTNEVYMCANAGRIYRIRDITVGPEVVVSDQSVTTQNFQRINGSGDTIIAVGALGVIAMSVNRGTTWSTPIGVSPTSGNLIALEVLDKYRWWLGSGTGGLWYTGDQGNTFNQITFPGLQRVDDIVFVTDEVGWIAGRTPNLTTARLYTTYNGGFSWTSSSLSRNPRIQNFLTFGRINRIGVPRNVVANTAANRILLGGLSAGGTDGIIVQGLPSIR